MLDHQNFSDNFKNNNLQNEDWLTPMSFNEGDVFDKAFGDEERKKPLTLWYMISALALALILGAFFLFQYQNNSKDSKIGLTESQQEIADSFSSVAHHTAHSNHHLSDGKKNKSSSASVQRTSEIRDDEIVATNPHLSKRTKSRDLQNTIGTNSDALKPSTRQSGSEEVVDTDLRYSASVASFLQPNFKSSNLPTTISEKRDTDHLKRLENYPFQTLKTDVPQLIEPLDQNLPIEVRSQINDYTGLSIMTYLSLWQMNMNQSYQDALEPAAFYHDSGNSFGLGLKYRKKLSEKVYSRISLNVEHAEFYSGHNSAVTYDQNDENMNANFYGLLMATPIGFVNTEIAIHRNQNDQSQRELHLDLSNRHSIISGNFSGGLEYWLFDRPQFAFVPHFDIGINHIFMLNNELINVDVDHGAYDFAGYSEITDQDELNRTRPFTSVGFDLILSKTKQHPISISYDWMYDVGTIYEFDNFNTKLNRHQFAISYGF